MLNAFAAEPKAVLLLSLQNSPSGMNLVCANHCLIVHPMFAETPEQARANEKQAVGRIVRTGQMNPCHIYRFVTANTIEEELSQQLRAP